MGIHSTGILQEKLGAKQGCWYSTSSTTPIKVYRNTPFLAQVDHGDGRRKKSRLEKMVATVQLQLALIKDVVDVGVVLSLKPILKSWQLCLSFKLDVLTT